MYSKSASTTVRRKGAWYDRIEAHQELLRRGELVRWIDLPIDAHIIFFSHEWVGWNPDPHGVQPDISQGHATVGEFLSWDERVSHVDLQANQKQSQEMERYFEHSVVLIHSSLARSSRRFSRAGTSDRLASSAIRVSSECWDDEKKELGINNSAYAYLAYLIWTYTRQLFGNRYVAPDFVVIVSDVYDRRDPGTNLRAKTCHCIEIEGEGDEARREKHIALSLPLRKVLQNWYLLGSAKLAVGLCDLHVANATKLATRSYLVIVWHSWNSDVDWSKAASVQDKELQTRKTRAIVWHNGGLVDRLPLTKSTPSLTSRSKIKEMEWHYDGQDSTTWLDRGISILHMLLHSMKLSYRRNFETIQWCESSLLVWRFPMMVWSRSVFRAIHVFTVQCALRVQRSSLLCSTQELTWRLQT